MWSPSISGSKKYRPVGNSHRPMWSIPAGLLRVGLERGAPKIDEEPRRYRLHPPDRRLTGYRARKSWFSGKRNRHSVSDRPTLVGSRTRGISPARHAKTIGLGEQIRVAATSNLSPTNGLPSLGLADARKAAPQAPRGMSALYERSSKGRKGSYTMCEPLDVTRITALDMALKLTNRRPSAC